MIDPNSFDDKAQMIREQYSGFSKSTRIIVMIGLVSVLLLGILESWRVADELTAESDALVTQINRAKNSERTLTPLLRNQVRSLGNIRLPHSDLTPFEAETLLFDAVHDILQENSAEMVQVDVLPSANLPSSAAPEVPRSAQQKLGKIVVRAEFHCPQDVLTRIISDFEKNPEIYTISRLQLDRFLDGPEEVRKLVSVDITLESWVLKSTVSRRSG